MGLFSRTPKEPEPHITRSFKAPQDVYRPGSYVAGSLTFQCPTQRRVERVEASFYGSCNTRAWRTESSGTGDNRKSETINYRDDVDLFRHSQLLAESFVAPPGQMFTWPFSFVFPTESTNLRGEVYRKDTACSPVYQVLPHALPPTFAFDVSKSTYARVEYNIEAVVHFEGAKEPLVVKFDQLQFSPYPPPHPSQAPYVEYVRQAENYATSRLTGQEKSFRRSVKDKFSSATPSVDVTMKASMMPVVATGASFPLFVCVEISNLSDPYAISVPEVKLRIKSLKLKQTSIHRGMREDCRSSQPEMEDTNSKTVLLNGLPENMVISSQIGDRKQLFYPGTFEARVPSDVCSTFRTVIIGYSCMLKAVVEADVCGKLFEHKFEIDALNILPS